MTTPRHTIGCLVLAIGLTLLLLAWLLTPEAGAQTLHGTRPGLHWWAWQSEVCPSARTEPPGRALVLCESGWVVVNVRTPYRAVWVDGRVLRGAVWLPEVMR